MDGLGQVDLVNAIFTSIDKAAELIGKTWKVETIGDCYQVEPSMLPGARVHPSPQSIPSGDTIPYRVTLHSGHATRGCIPRTLALNRSASPAHTTTQGPSWGYFKSQFLTGLSIVGKCSLQNGFKTVPKSQNRPLGYPHEGPLVGPHSGALSNTRRVPIREMVETIGGCYRVKSLQPCTPHPTPYTLHPTPYTLHPTPYILHPTPYTLHPSP